MFQRITANLLGAQKRYETLDGEKYLVVPYVSLKEGVWEGSAGPIYYPSQEVGRNPVAWNSKPLLIHHPVTSTGDTNISGCNPDVVERQGVGSLYNTGFDGRLRGEAWFKEAKLKRVNNKVFEDLDQGRMVEVSTGLYHDLEPTEGEFQGKKYKGIVRNIQPDHLAILPDQKGAFSVADGGGLLRNAAKQDTTIAGLSFDDIRSQISSLLREDRKVGTKAYCEDFCYVCEVYPKFAVFESNGKCCKIGYKVKGSIVSLDGEPEEVHKVTSYVTANGAPLRNEDQQGPLKLPKPKESDLSDPMRRQQLQKSLSLKYSGVQQEGDWGWVTDIYANYVVWSKDGKLFRLPYTYDDDKITFDGEEEEVERVSEYRTKKQVPIDGTTSPYNVNQEPIVVNKPTQRQLDVITQLADMAKNNKLTVNVIHQGAHQLIHEATHHDAHETEPHKGDSQVRTDAGGGRKDEVNKMISGGGWGEEDRKFLEDLPDDHFARVKGHTMKGATQPIVPYTYEGIGDRSAVGATAHNQQMTTQQYIANAPPGIREMLTNALAAQDQEKANLIKAITSNANNRFNPKWLAERPIPELQGLAALAGVSQQRPTVNYGGQAEVPMFLDPTPTTNAGGDVEVLPLPNMWAKEQAS